MGSFLDTVSNLLKETIPDFIPGALGAVGSLWGPVGTVAGNTAGNALRGGIKAGLKGTDIGRGVQSGLESSAVGQVGAGVSDVAQGRTKEGLGRVLGGAGRLSGNEYVSAAAGAGGAALADKNAFQGAVHGFTAPLDYSGKHDLSTILQSGAKVRAAEGIDPYFTDLAAANPNNIPEPSRVLPSQRDYGLLRRDLPDYGYTGESGAQLYEQGYATPRLGYVTDDTSSGGGYRYV